MFDELTQIDIDKMKEELEYRIGVVRPQILEDVKFARSHGDLSENAEYDAARNEQAQNEARILELQALIDNALIIDETKIDSSVVSIGSTVTVYDYEFEEEVEYSIVGSNEVDPLAGKISDQSPIGHALMSKAAGAEVSVDTPSGVVKLKVLNVTRK